MELDLLIGRVLNLIIHQLVHLSCPLAPAVLIAGKVLLSKEIYIGKAPLKIVDR
jgi:hypothetical protein